MNKQMIFLWVFFSAAIIFSGEPLFKPGTLYNSHWKTAGLFYSKFNHKTINSIAYHTGSGSCKSEPNPKYGKKETADGTLYIFKRRFMHKNGNCIGHDLKSVFSDNQHYRF